MFIPTTDRSHPMRVKNCTHLIGERVEVYWNLHKNCYSVRALSGPRRGRVVAHTFLIDLADVSFAVGAKGRQRIVNGEPKNVHAFIRGTVIASRDGCVHPYEEVTYNPRKYASFVRKADESSITRANIVRAFTDNRCKPVVFAV
jgi:hypothetical protein